MPRNVSRKERPMPPPAPVISTRCIMAASLRHLLEAETSSKAAQRTTVFRTEGHAQSQQPRWGHPRYGDGFRLSGDRWAPLHGAAVGRPRYRLPLLRNHGDDLHLDQPGPDPVGLSDA